MMHWWRLVALVLALNLAPGASMAQTDPASDLSADEMIDALTPPPRPRTRGLSVQAHDEEMPRIDLAVEFEFASHRLTPQARGLLNNLAEALQSPALAGHRFRLAGHTDAVGSHAVNDRLSLQRAEAVHDYLVAEHGLDPARLEVEGHGKRQLLFVDAPEDARNRRVEVSVLAE